MSAPEVIYDEGPPRRYTVNGKDVPSVTQILSVLDKPALVWWGMTTGVDGICELQKQGVEIPWDDPQGVTKLLTEHKMTVNHRRDTAATRGQSVHAALEAWASGRKIPKLSDFPMEDRGYVQALASFLIDYMPECIATEVVVGSVGEEFAGRYDLKCRINGEVGILDLKTGKRIYDTVHLQLAAYRFADECMTGDPVDVTWALRLGVDGKYELVEGRGTFDQFWGVRMAYVALQELKASGKKAKAKAAA